MADHLKFKSANNHYDLVVEGGVNSLTNQQFIALSKPATNLLDSVSPINDAEVFIEGTPLKLYNKNGIYAGVILNNKRYNEAYHLKVIYRNKTYEAFDTLKQVLPITTAELNLFVQQQNDEINISIPKHSFIKGESAKIFYHFSGGVNWSPSIFNKVQLYSYIHPNPPPYGLSPILEQRTNYIFQVSDSFEVSKFSESDAYSQYLYQIFQETDWRSIFSGNPGAIKGNISGNALGFFYCTDVLTKKIAIKDILQ
ncbi:MAG: hypothetical protein IE931_09740 [Sphingobacteriales bacterium]|nr:hypothetical protein [Sphingobacteriales bacterium]